MSLKKIKGNIRRITTNAQKLNVLIHETGVLILEHAQAHGDCTEALNLVKAMPASMRRTMLVLWFDTYSPIRVALQNDKVGLAKAESKNFKPFDIEAAKATPFYELAEQNPEKSYDFAALVKMVESLGKQIEKKIADGKVPVEDRASAEAVARKVQSLRFERVTEVTELDEPANDQNVAAVA